jgi:AraC family transcriptional regulator, transcriptional activator of pobA
MTKIVELQTFYKNIEQSPADNDSEYGHFNIFRIEDMVLPKYRKASYSRRSFYKVTLIKGHSKVHYADRDIEINGSALVFSNPSIQYYWEMISEKQSGYMCIFTESFFHRFGNLRDFVVFQSAGAAVLTLSQEQASLYEPHHEAQKAVPLPAELFPDSNAAERIATSFTELMERQFPIELTYQELKLNSPAAFAAQQNIHVNHLNKALKAIKGRTTSQLINERILQEARTLLKSTNWTIAEIAFSLGFGEANHFSAFFKSLAKITAKKYREINKD